ncbi:MAG: transposase [Phycisphaerales bacterium]
MAPTGCQAAKAAGKTAATETDRLATRMISGDMPRRRRNIVPGTEHHVVQRASQGRFILAGDDRKAMMMSLLIGWSARAGVSIAGFVLMDNHFHLIATPGDEESLGFMMARATADFSRWINLSASEVGPNWQGAFFAAAMDERHAITALRYIERNPVEAGLVAHPWQYRWSSAAFHSGIGPRPSVLTRDVRDGRMSPREWREFVDMPLCAEVTRQLRECTSRGTPFADDQWIDHLESKLGMTLRPKRIGRPRTRDIRAEIP